MLYSSPLHGLLLYNTRTRALLSLPEDMRESIKSLSQMSDFSLENVPEEMRNPFLGAKAIVPQGEDDNFYIQKKYLKYKENFNTHAVGFVIVPTLECNFACPYCYEKGRRYGTMNEDTVKQLLKFVGGFDNVNRVDIGWHGGEPLMAKETIFKILDGFNKLGIKLNSHSIVTNGYLLDRETCEKFKEYGLSFVQITIDGMSQTHDKTRIKKDGSSTFEKIISNVETLFEVDPSCQVLIRMNVHKGNSSEFAPLYKYLSKKWAGRKYVLSLQYVEDLNGCNVQCMKHKERIQFMRNLFLEEGIEANDFFPTFQLGGCSADHANTYIIGPDGGLYKCWVEVGKEEKKIGSIFEPNLSLPKLSEYVVGSDMFNDSKCEKCKFFPICDGGCELARLKYKQEGIPYDVCPYSDDSFSLILDSLYEKNIQ